MKTRIFLVTLAVLVFASLSFGQGFCRQIYNDDHPLLQPAADGSCTGEPYPDGHCAFIYWDTDANGFEDPALPGADPLADLGGAYPVNYNAFPINGVQGFLGPGLFVADGVTQNTCMGGGTFGDFCSQGGIPVPNARYYIVVFCPTDPAVWQWHSEVATFVSGADVYDFNVWDCNPAGCISVQPCVPTQGATIYGWGSDDGNQIGWGTSVCLDLCSGFTTTVSICAPPGYPALDPTKAPVSTVRPGCLPPYCDVACDAAANYQVVGPTYNTATGCWDYLIIGGDVEGCVCFTFEYFLAASIDANSFAAIAGDGEVRLSWTSLAESNVSNFRVVRNGQAIGSVDATNNPSGSAYTYTDETAVNGTSYSYTLHIVNVDNSITETGLEVSATPSFGAAVITEYALHQNFPNPFNPSTEITFDVLNSNPVTLKVYNAAGQEVATLVNGATYEGGKRYVMNFDATNLTSGLYFYTVKVGNEFSATKKMLLVK